MLRGKPSGTVTDTRPPRQPLVSAGGCDLQQRDMTATFAADVPLRVAQDRLREIGQWLPVDGDENASVGALVESNSTGPLRLGYGAWRDLLLGVQFINGRGELVSAGGQTVKNVAGYDLTKFMVGQGGVFGRIVTITTRTYRRPAGALHARFAPGANVTGWLLATPLRPQWVMRVPDALWCGYLGDEAALAFYRERLGGAEPVEILAASLEDDTRRRSCFAWRSGNEEFRGTWGSILAADCRTPSPGAPGEGVWRSTWGITEFRASLPPARLEEFVAKVPVKDWAADPAFGVVVGMVGELERSSADQPRLSGSGFNDSRTLADHSNPVNDRATALEQAMAEKDGARERSNSGSVRRSIREAAEAAGGSVYFLGPAGGQETAAAIFNFSTTPVQRQIIERLKIAFDPDGKLTPLPWQIR